jgi:hypothetical protein
MDGLPTCPSPQWRLEVRLHIVRIYSGVTPYRDLPYERPVVECAHRIDGTAQCRLMHEHQTVTADLSGASVHRDKPAATDSPFSCTPRLLNDAGARQLVPGSVSAVSVENAPVADSSEAKSKTKSKLRGGFLAIAQT